MPEPRPCPACGGPLAPWRRVPSSDPTAAPGWFDLLRCTRCASAVTIEPAPAEAHETGAYGGGSPRLYRIAAPLLAWFDRRRLRLVRRAVPPPARLLDAGAGRGRFVASAGSAGYAAAGIEPSARGIAGARELSARVTRATIDSAEIDDGSFDAVTLWHVLEHLEDPARAIETIARWLRPGGALLVGVPNLASLQARIGEERWYHLDVPRHRTHFTADGIASLLAAHGFAIVHTTHVLAEQNPFGMWQSLVSRLTREPSYLYHLLKRNAPVVSPDLAITLLALPLVPVAAALELMAGLAGRGGTIAVLARRVSDPGSGAE
ncbi:MAG TPA: class I SAM-dependent methyltransferase [Solirubrobacteraceae bacterium]|nr:class I SAM-dependent methyltransferase [Solirubrobacteraceae bacterium]